MQDALETDLQEAHRRIEELEEQLLDARAALVANAQPTTTGYNPGVISLQASGSVSGLRAAGGL
jgi:hypothetical protein